MPTYDGGGEDDGHGVVENALPEDQHIQYRLHVQSCIHTQTMSHYGIQQNSVAEFGDFIAKSGTEIKGLPTRTKTWKMSITTCILVLKSFIKKPDKVSRNMLL